MSFKNWMILALFFLFILLYEHLTINYSPSTSFLLNLQSLGYIDKKLDLSTDPGNFLSFTYGIVGFVIMLFTNFYIIRKRVSFLKSFGNLTHWLNIHIFFGVLGPIFIIFHSDFKVRGIVSISFWSMIIAASSGFVGRYFYINAAKKQKEYMEMVDNAITDLKRAVPKDKESDKDFLKGIVAKGFAYMGGTDGEERVSFAGLPMFVMKSMFGDLKVALGVSVIKEYRGTSLDTRLKYVSKLKRNVVYQDTYRRLLSYWHTFHLPFTFFMYVTAVIHIISSLIFKV